ncbi:MAG: hypothetical protein GXP59_04910 [Deltaproteobacteria bacterium]|nr:hypothetical protein [Deltaproteobacteria bacterium]
MRISKIFLVTLLFVLCSLTAKAKLVDRIVAVVNDDIITLSDLNAAGRPYFQAIMRRAPADRQAAELNKARKKVIGQLVDRLLIKQRAAQIGIEVSKADIDQAVASILHNNRINMKKFRHDLRAIGTSEADYRRKIKAQILKSRLISFAIRSKIVITEQKIKQYYDHNYTAARIKTTGYHILQIGLLWGAKYRAKTQEEARKNAEYAKKKLLAGGNFAELAKELSDLPSAADGGDLGQFKKADMAPYMAKAVLTMHVDEISKILQTPVGYQILKLKSAPGHEIPKLADVKDEIKAILYKQEAEKDYQEWLDKLRRKAFIKYNP